MSIWKSIAAILTILVPLASLADLPNPEYLKQKCRAGEQEVECTFSRQSKRNGGWIESGDCDQYSKNPDYYFLVGEAHTFGGKSKYCKGPAPTKPMPGAVKEESRTGLAIGVIALASLIG